MVFCTRCGTQIGDDTKYCTNCGAEVVGAQAQPVERRAEDWGETFGRRAEEWGEAFGRRAEEWGKQFEKRAEEECFRLPHGGTIAGLIIGVLIILAGVAWIAGITLAYIGAFIVIIVGILIIAGALYGLRRK